MMTSATKTALDEVLLAQLQLVATLDQPAPAKVGKALQRVTQHLEALKLRLEEIGA